MCLATPAATRSIANKGHCALQNQDNVNPTHLGPKEHGNSAKGGPIPRAEAPIGCNKGPVRMKNWVRSDMSAAALIAVFALVFPLGQAATAADIGSSCCVDLEERIAELESSVARKGNRKVSLTVTGQVNKTLLLWDDGQEKNVYISGNKNDQTNFAFAGDAQISAGLKAGYEIVIRVRDDLSDAVNQNTPNGDDGCDVWQANWYLESDKLGKVTVGVASRVSDTAPEADFSEAGVAGYAGVQDIGGGFFLRRADGTLADVAWGDIYSHFNGDTANLVRYDTPSFGGFILSASWGEDDIWDVGARYAYEGNGIQFEAAVAYTEVTDEGGEPGHVDEDTVVGSASILHEATGLNFTIAAGRNSNNVAALDADGISRFAEDKTFLYVKAGWIAKLNSFGPTAFYAEYGIFSDFLSAGAEAATVASLAGGTAGCVAAGDACRITGNSADVWGLGVVQHIEAADMQLYLGYRRHSADVDLLDQSGAAVSDANFEDFHTVISGAKIAF
jgi:predicted porin